MKHRWLHAGRLAVLAVAVIGTPLGAQQTNLGIQNASPTAQIARSGARPPDVASPQAIVEALYDVITGPAARPRDWDRFRSLFLSGAQLAWVQPGPGGQSYFYNLSVEDFIRLAGPGYQMGEGFWEREIGHHVDQFGTIAQVFSTYEMRLAGPKADVVERGINGVQLLYYQNRWWITNLVFDTETPSNPIPSRYLGNTGG
ncbi:MAG TPA: hypothetical protein VE871_14415 [Longimicrobium sp.]|nr:hypothetical protein [Longimicrobium sp.]